MIKRFALSLVLGGCTLYGSVGTDGPSDHRTQVALVPVTASNDVDLLFVVDDSPGGGTDLQRSLQLAFPTLLQGLSGPSGLPSLHIGVVSPDLGTKGAEDAQPGPGIGSGPGSCAGNGKAGNLQTSGTPLVTGNFIHDRDTGGGVRETNYTGTLSDAFTALSSLGSDGCGFEQSLEAAKRALDNNPANSGFLRPDARLAVIVVTNEDDCSIAHSTLMGPEAGALGPLQSFRCTRFGVVCDGGGRTSTEMNEPGAKSECRANASTQYLTNVDATAAFIQNLKGDGRNVMFGAIAGVGTTLEVAMEVPPGGGLAMPALQPACTWPSSSAIQIDPAIRIHDAASSFARHYIQMACGAEMTAPAAGIAREIRGMLGDACLTRSIAAPADCEAWDTRADGSMTLLPACGNHSGDCYRFIQDGGCSAGLRLEVVRTVIPPTDTMVSLRCKV
jgi:uncharacterized protein YfiM (DUF2279 family)